MMNPRSDVVTLTGGRAGDRRRPLPARGLISLPSIGGPQCARTCPWSDGGDPNRVELVAKRVSTTMAAADFRTGRSTLFRGVLLFRALASPP